MMFATLRNNKEDDSLYVHHVGSSKGHQACNSCRMRKVRLKRPSRSMSHPSRSRDFPWFERY
jgi:hypothetical protein